MTLISCVHYQPVLAGGCQEVERRTRLARDPDLQSAMMRADCCERGPRGGRRGDLDEIAFACHQRIARFATIANFQHRVTRDDHEFSGEWRSAFSP